MWFPILYAEIWVHFISWRLFVVCVSITWFSSCSSLVSFTVFFPYVVQIITDFPLIIFQAIICLLTHSAVSLNLVTLPTQGQTHCLTLSVGNQILQSSLMISLEISRAYWNSLCALCKKKIKKWKMKEPVSVSFEWYMCSYPLKCTTTH